METLPDKLKGEVHLFDAFIFIIGCCQWGGVPLIEKSLYSLPDGFTSSLRTRLRNADFYCEKKTLEVAKSFISA